VECAEAEATPVAGEAEPELAVASEPARAGEAGDASRETSADEPNTPTRRESVLRLMAAMYPEVASKVPALPTVDAASSGVRRSVEEGFVVFHLGGESFAIALRQVVEADRLPAITPVPFVPEFVRGVANRRGEVLLLIDLRLLFGVEQEVGVVSRPIGDGRMLVVRRSESEPAAALVVDSLGGIAWMNRLHQAAPLESRLGPVADKLAELLSATGEHRGVPLPVVDLDRLFARKELEELAAA
jgi:chemotaxis signal transduction protein